MGRTRSPCCKSKDQIALAIDMNCLDVSAIYRKASSWAKVALVLGCSSWGGKSAFQHCERKEAARGEFCHPTWTWWFCCTMRGVPSSALILHDTSITCLLLPGKALIFAKSNCTKIKVEFQSPRSKTKYKQNQKGVTSQKCEIVTVDHHYDVDKNLPLTSNNAKSHKANTQI